MEILKRSRERALEAIKQRRKDSQRAVIEIDETEGTKTDSDKVEEIVDSAIGDILQISESIKRAIAECEEDKIKLENLATVSKDMDGLGVVDALMDSCKNEDRLKNNLQRAYHALYVFTYAEDKIVKNYALDLRVHYFPRTIKAATIGCKFLASDDEINRTYKTLLRNP